MKQFLPWLLGCIGVAALLIATPYFLIWLYDADDINHWKKTTYEFNHTDNWLLKCAPQEVRMQWHQEEGWIDNLTIDLQAKTISGSSGDGISFSAPFALVMAPEKPQRPTLTDDQVALIRNAITQLPPGETQAAWVPDYSHDFRVALYENGSAQVRHYPIEHIPPSIARLGKELHLIMPMQD